MSGTQLFSEVAQPGMETSMALEEHVTVFSCSLIPRSSLTSLGGKKVLRVWAGPPGLGGWCLGAVCPGEGCPTTAGWHT